MHTPVAFYKSFLAAFYSISLCVQCFDMRIHVENAILSHLCIHAYTIFLWRCVILHYNHERTCTILSTDPGQPIASNITFRHDGYILDWSITVNKQHTFYSRIVAKVTEYIAKPGAQRIKQAATSWNSMLTVIATVTITLLNWEYMYFDCRVKCQLYCRIVRH